jgi:protein-disulfide isomerase
MTAVDDPAADPAAAAVPEGVAPPPAEPAPPEPGPPEPAPPAGQDTRGRRSRAPALGLVALAVVLAFGAGILVGRASAPDGDAATPLAAAGSPGASTGASPTGSPAPTGVAALPSEGNRLGRADATVVIDYWADYQCPFCARFAEDVIPALESRLQDGTVALVHRDYAFLGPESLDAAVAVRCAAREGRYWAMHDAVYAGQVGENQGAFARPRLAQIAATVGLDATAFAACMDEREPLLEVLEDTSAGVRAGITSTPTVDVNGNRFLGVPDMTALLASIDAAAAGATPGVLPTPGPLGDAWTGITTDGREAGAATAPVTVELWMDYQATDGAAIAKQLEPELRSRVTAGDIRVVQRDLATLGDESVLAASAVRCVARQGGPAWLVHDALALSARGAGSGIYTETSLLRFAARLGLDIRAFSTCLDDPVVAADVRAETAEGTTAGLTGSPAVVVRKGGTEVARFTGSLDVAEVVAAIDAAR